MDTAALGSKVVRIAVPAGEESKVPSGKAWEQIGRSRNRVADLAAPAQQGVYAIFLRAKARFPVPAGDDGLLYVGRSSNLAQREFDTHFAEGKSGFSTLRRSIGALLKEELNLVAIPRGRGAAASNYQHYRFTNDSERRLAQWMEDNLEVGVAATEDSTLLEEELMSHNQPVLCLRGWPNPSAPAISQKRKACVEEARKTSR